MTKNTRRKMFCRGVGGACVHKAVAKGRNLDLCPDWIRLEQFQTLGIARGGGFQPHLCRWISSNGLSDS